MTDRVATQRLDSAALLEQRAADHAKIAEHMRDPVERERVEREAAQLREDARRMRRRFTL